MRAPLRLLLVAVVALTLIVRLQATVLFQDTFVDSDTVNLNSHTPTPSGGFTWNLVTGGMEILSNQANGSNGSVSAVSFFDMAAGTADAVVQVDLVVPTGNMLGGITVRGSAYNDVWLMAIEEDGSGPYVAIVERTGGAQTYHNTTSISAIAGTTITMTVTVSANNLRLQAGTADTTYVSAIRNTDQTMGIFSYYGGGYTIVPEDNFLVSTVGPPPPSGTGCHRALLGVGCDELAAGAAVQIAGQHRTDIAAWLRDPRVARQGEQDTRRHQDFGSHTAGDSSTAARLPATRTP